MWGMVITEAYHDYVNSCFLLYLSDGKCHQLNCKSLMPTTYDDMVTKRCTHGFEGGNGEDFAAHLLSYSTQRNRCYPKNDPLRLRGHASNIRQQVIWCQAFNIQLQASSFYPNLTHDLPWIPNRQIRCPALWKPLPLVYHFCIAWKECFAGLSKKK